VWTAAVGNGPTELVSVNGSVWVTVTDDGDLVEVDAESGEIRTNTPLGGASAGGGPTGISYADGSLWVAMQGEQSVVRIDIG
jgi:streptogramin lyase